MSTEAVVAAAGAAGMSKLPILVHNAALYE